VVFVQHRPLRRLQTLVLYGLQGIDARRPTRGSRVWTRGSGKAGKGFRA